MNKTAKVFIWVAVILLAAVIVYFLVIKKPAADISGEEASSPASSPQSRTSSSPAAKQEIVPILVKALPVSRGEVVLSLRSPGEVYTERKIIVKAEVGSTIRNLNVAEGRHVRKDDLLVVLDDREFQLALHKLEALRLKALSEVLLEKMFAVAETPLEPAALEKINRAREAFERADERYKSGLGSQQEWEKARRDYELVLIESGSKKEELISSTKNLTQTEVDVRLAELNLERTKIRAPFPGIITDIKVCAGERVSSGQDLFSLVDIGQLKVRASVLEGEIGKVRVGREVSVRFPAYPGRSFKGIVEAVSPVVKPEDRTCSVYIKIHNPGEEIKPGMHAEVEIASDIYSNRLIVPQKAILVRAGRKLVFVVEGEFAKWRYIETGVENEEFAEVVDGVKEGEMVITEGHFTLAHDARVSVVRE